MERRKTYRAVEALKTMLIVLLALSAAWLFSRALLYTGLPGVSDWAGELASLLRPAAAASGAGQSGQTALSATGLSPARVAVSNEDGRCGLQYDADVVNAAFEDRLGGLLGEALAGAGVARPVTEEAWRTALRGPGVSVYYDFLGGVPLTALSKWLSGDFNAVLTGDARRLLLCSGGDGDTALLYYTAGDGLFYVCSTTVRTDSRLAAVAAEYTPNNAAFAFEQSDRYPHLDPYVMILPDTPAPMVYQASNPIAAADGDTLDALMSGLLFHPRTSSVYQAADGQVVREGTDTLRISDNGTVTFHAAEAAEARYPVDAAGSMPTRGEMVDAARALAKNALADWCGDAGLYLMGTETRQDGSVEVRFGYLLDGAAVQLYEDGCAARIVITGGYISDFTLNFRAYEATGTACAVLPELQAAAAMDALHPAGDELVLCYLDAGGTQVTAGWVAKEP